MTIMSEAALIASVRRWRALTIAIAVSQVVLLVAAFASKDPEEIRAQKFTLVDKDGNTRAVFGEVGEPGIASGIEFFDLDKKSRMLVGLVGHDLPFIKMSAADGTRVAGLEGWEAGGRLHLSRKDCKASFYAGPSDGSELVCLTDAAGKQRLVASVEDDGQSSFILKDSNETARLGFASGAVAASKCGVRPPGILVLGADGAKRAEMTESFFSPPHD